MNRYFCSMITAILLVSVAPASAFVMVRNDGAPVRWPGLTVNVWFDPNVSSSADRAALDAAIAAWNRTPARITINRYYSSTRTEMDNGRNEIRWISNKADIGWRPAVCFWVFDGTELVEADVVFAADWGFTTSNDKADLNAYSGTARSLYGNALHELGHFLGLAHENDVYNIMGDDSTHAHVNGWRATFYVGEDATRGVGHIYGEIERHDVGVSHWRYIGASGEYSSHGRTRIANATGTVLTEYSVDSEPYYILNRGTSYRLQSTLENLGSIDEVIDMRYVLSTNDTITTADTTLRTVSNVSLVTDIPSTYSAASFTIPTTTPAGEYWIGVVLDPLNELAESDEGNNATYVAKVRVQ